MNDTQLVEVAEIIADKVCQKLLVIGGTVTLVTGLSIMAFVAIVPSVTFEIYRRKSLKE